MRVIITGNMGYVGSVLVPILAQKHPDWRLVGLDTGFFGHCIVPAHPLPERFLSNQLVSDLRMISESELSGFDAIVHLASLSNDPLGNQFDELTKAINVEASFRFAKLAKSAGVKNFVFASSCSVYGRGSDKDRNEGDPLDPLTPYARSKIDLENRLREIADSNFSVVALRFATACGFSPRMRSDLVLNDFVINAMISNRIQVLSDGTPWRPLIHVSDMSRAIDWALTENPVKPFLTLNIGSEAWTFQISTLANVVAQAIGNVSVEIASTANVDSRSYRVDFSRFRQLAPVSYTHLTLPTKA